MPKYGWLEISELLFEIDIFEILTKTQSSQVVKSGQAEILELLF